MHGYEQTGAFYLGKTYDPGTARTRDELLLYDARHLTTHAVIVGMTGSGKTGLGLALLEEAAIDGIPAIVVDPKGDLGNLLLAFPSLAPADFRPWVDEREAQRQGLTPDELAARTAARWREGLGAWGQDGARIARFRDAAETRLYTPGARAGLPLSVLRSFAAPPPAVRDQPDLLRDRIQGTVAGVLALAGVSADPLRGREAILLAQILDRAWSEGRDLDLPALIRQVSAPPFAQVGVFDLESFFPAGDRLALAMQLNALVASPGFSVWTQGEPLDVGSLLYGPGGKPRLSVLSIAHLSDAERMFFVTLLLNEVVAWMRTQPGTSSLRALLYMDEIFGYFPPTAAPPSKLPMLTLLKQARAFGLGVVLATQNPVDLDYKGLANAGTWFVGRLQTERDKQRLLDGLEGALAAGGQAFQRAEIERVLSGLGNRVFLMNDVHDDAPALFQTRWALSYLAGPLSRDQIQRLVGGASTPADNPPSPAPLAPPEPVGSGPVGGERPVLPAEVPEFFLPATGDDPVVYRAALFASGRVRFVNAKAGVDQQETVALRLPLTGDEAPAASAWEHAKALDPTQLTLDKQPQAGARFAPLPANVPRKAALESWRRAFVQHLCDGRVLRLHHCPALATYARPGESEAAFRQRLRLVARERRDAEVEKLRRRYAPKVQALQDKIRRAEDRIAQEEADFQAHGMDVAVNAGAALLGALMGRRGSGWGGARRSLRSANRAAKERADLDRAHEALALAQDQLRALEADLEADFRKVHANAEAALATVTSLELRPRKSDVAVGAIGVLWTGTS